MSLEALNLKERLSKYFVTVASKRLSAVEIEPGRSNQHEFNGVGGLRTMFGSDRSAFDKAGFVYLSEDPDHSSQATAKVTWYDARANHPTRTEYRLYYEGNSVMDKASAGDLLVIGLTPDERVIVAIAERGTTAEHQLSWLFDTPESGTFFVHADTQGFEVGFVGRYILQWLGVDTTEQLSGNELETMLNTFGDQFPSTGVFASYARETLAGYISSNPDTAIVQFIEREEALFRMFEQHSVMRRLADGFAVMEDFEGFAKYWLNRRYSRAGHSFEHHLRYLFTRAGISYTSGRVTEGHKKPDFMFPHIAAYHLLPDEKVNLLVTSLAAKTTCKDRWRQVLNEADRLHVKHLVTLEPGISVNQTAEMQAEGVQLVIPLEVQQSYKDKQQQWLMSLSDFMDTVQRQQKGDWGIHSPSISVDDIIQTFSVGKSR